MNRAFLLPYIIVIFLTSHQVVGQLNTPRDELIQEHVLGGLPSNDNVLAREAYVLDYDSTRKVPRWVAYHLTKDYRRTPKRVGQWEDYREDPNIVDEPTKSDYTGTYADSIRGYHKGHLAPFFISGGDRDGDGEVLDADQDGEVEDGDDSDEAITVYQINYYTNLTPQHGRAFNTGKGVWYGIEKRIRKLIQSKNDLWVFAGPIFGAGEYDTIDNGVAVAPMFFQIITWQTSEGEYEWEAYMMPHHQQAHGSIFEHLVSIRHIEAMTGLNFFETLGLGDAERLSTYKKPGLLNVFR